MVEQDGVRVVVATTVGVAERWRKQYQYAGRWKRTAKGDSEEIYNSLCALGPTPRKEDVNQIVGNTFWTTVWCTECGEQVDRVATMGTHDARFCADCLAKAARALTTIRPPAPPAAGTVRVRIPVHVRNCGDLSVYWERFSTGHEYDGNSPGRASICITADIPLPQPVEFPGAVEVNDGE